VLHRGGVSLDALAEILPFGWRADTAWIDDWNEQNPARGQCGSTALVVQDLRGGTLMRGLVRDRSHETAVHYWNVLATGGTDLTWQQFSPSARVVECKAVARTDLLCSSWFVDRYRTLGDRVQLLLGEETFPE
jgi:hypothetical protein